MLMYCITSRVHCAERDFGTLTPSAEAMKGCTLMAMYRTQTCGQVSCGVVSHRS